MQRRTSQENSKKVGIHTVSNREPMTTALPSSSSVVHPAESKARMLLNRIRQVKSTAQCESVFTDLIAFIEGQYAFLNTTSSSNSGSSSRPLDSAERRRTVNRVLLACSALAGAFSRRALYVQSHFLAADGGRSSAWAAGLQQQLSDMESRLEAMGRLTAAVEASQRGGPKPVLEAPAAETTSSASAAPLWYGLGELKDFRHHQTAAVLERLRGLTAAHAHWDVVRIANTVRSLSGLEEALDPFVQCMDGALTATRAVTPLRDPLSQALIEVPCRGARCTHWEVFDAVSFIRSVQRSLAHDTQRGEPSGLCPFCRTRTPLTSLRVDEHATRAMEAFSNSSDGAGLSADHALAWDIDTRQCRVVDGRQFKAAAAVVDGEPYCSDHDEEQEDEEKESGRKRRRVEIEGHVLYIDE